MLFTTFQYILFFTVVLVLYWSVPGPKRWIVIVFSSLIFYTASIPEYAAVLVVSVLVNYYFGLRIGNEGETRIRKRILAAGIIINLFFLAVFKYADEFIITAFPGVLDNTTLSNWLHASFRYSDSAAFSIILPLGISFFTFTNISYLIDVKRATLPPERHLGYFAAYITFFPKLIQGPIERASHFLPQVRNPRMFSYTTAAEGLRLILWGFFKKMVIADRLGVAVDQVFANPEAHEGPVLVFAAILYSFQIYMDFSSYIDMARGMGRLMGFELVKNFNVPYMATSIKDFWERWHISLSAWLRDYIFLPVAFKMSKILKKERYLLFPSDQIIYAAAATVTFLIAGLWHGTGWNFIFWGGLFAVYLIIANMTSKTKRSFYRWTGIHRMKRLYNSFQVLVTFTLVTFTWIFFRSQHLEAAFSYISLIPKGWKDFFTSPGMLQKITFPGFTAIDLVLVTAAIFFTETIEYHFYHQKMLSVVRHPPRLIRWGFYYALLLALFYFGKSGSGGFIYFQF